MGAQEFWLPLLFQKNKEKSLKGAKKILTIDRGLEPPPKGERGDNSQKKNG